MVKVIIDKKTKQNKKQKRGKQNKTKNFVLFKVRKNLGKMLVSTSEKNDKTDIILSTKGSIIFQTGH